MIEFFFFIEKIAEKSWKRLEKGYSDFPDIREHNRKMTDAKNVIFRRVLGSGHRNLASGERSEPEKNFSLFCGTSGPFVLRGGAPRTP